MESSFRGCAIITITSHRNLQLSPRKLSTFHFLIAVWQERHQTLKEHRKRCTKRKLFNDISKIFYIQAILVGRRSKWEGYGNIVTLGSRQGHSQDVGFSVGF